MKNKESKSKKRKIRNKSAVSSQKSITSEITKVCKQDIFPLEFLEMTF